MKQNVIFTNDVVTALKQVCDNVEYDKCFVLCDANVEELVLPLLACEIIDEATVINIPAGEENKNLDTLMSVWKSLVDNGATRHSLLINVGGGVVTDLGGFAAATYKRGIRFVNIPTTLLCAVDAAVGGKTGVDFAGLKNEVGAFALAEAVIVSSRFFSTLPREEVLSGYAEMLKLSILDGVEHYNSLAQSDILNCNNDVMLDMLQRSVAVKQKIVEQDPCESGLRQVLNLGHTIGHAFESHALLHKRPVRHGYAVAWGLVCELILSHRLLSFPSHIIYDVAHWVERNYGAYVITCDDYDELIALMQHDKKNRDGKIRFALMSDWGVCEVNREVECNEIEISLDFYRDLFHL